MKLGNIARQILIEKKGRSKPISAEEAMSWIKKNAPITYNDPHGDPKIYRGVASDQSKKSNTLFIDPSKHERRSRFATDNLYNLIFSNSDRWKQYPRRDQSIICSTDFGVAASYSNKANVFAVISKEGSTYGICPEHDIQVSFPVLNEIGLSGSFAVVHLIKMVRQLAEFCSDFDNIPHKFHDFAQLKDMLSSIEYEYDCIRNHTMKLDRDSLILAKKWNESGYNSLYDYIDSLLDPKKNGFTTAKAPLFLKGNKEVWTDQPSILINVHIYDEFFEAQS